jgi:ER lumen protein retaining receptor
MSAIADGVDFFLNILSFDSASKPKASRSQLFSGVGGIYMMSVFAWCLIWKTYSSKQFSSILTCSSLVQLCGFLLLTIKVRATKSVSGISSKTLEMYLIFFMCRLGSTLNKKGYIPSDKTGRGVYQTLDIISVCVILQLLYCIHKTHKPTYQKDQDTMMIAPLLPPCVLLACFIRMDLSRDVFYDGLWATSAYVDTVAMLPQLWMLSKVGGYVEGMTSHFIAAMTVRSAMALLFWVRAYSDCIKYGSSELSATTVIVTFVVQLFLAADFLYYYVKARFSGNKLVLPENPLGASAGVDI